MDPYGAFVAMVSDVAPGRKVAVKDMIAVAGMPQSAGLPARAGRLAAEDADIVAALRDAGWAVAGVTATDAAGFGTMTPAVANPRHPGRAVGGSSGGSAAAVAAGLAELGLGTDTGGSGRIPAAYCGLAAFKPSAGRSPMDGILPLAPTFDAPALMAADLATVAEAAPAVVTDWVGGDARPPRCLAAGWVAGIADLPVVLAYEAALRRFDIADELAEPVPYEAMAIAHGMVVCAEAFAVHADDLALDPAGFPEPAASGLAYGRTLQPHEIAEARAFVAAAGAAWRGALGDDEILLVPTLPMAPAARFATTATVRGVRMPITNANIRLTMFANVAGLPVVVAEVDGLSLQFVGGRGRDEWLLAAVGRLLAAALTPA